MGEGRKCLNRPRGRGGTDVQSWRGRERHANPGGVTLKKRGGGGGGGREEGGTDVM